MIDAISNAWESLKKWGNTVPNCPCCEGTGVSKREYENTALWWRGLPVRGCFHCDGRGKV